MNDLNETTETTATAAAKAPEAPKKKATPGARAPRAAKPEGKPGKKTTAAKKAPKTAPKAKAARQGKAAKEKGVREGSKTQTILELLKRPGGVTSKELMKVTGWQPHSLRGFLSGTVGKKMGLAVVSTKGEDGERSYSVKA